MHVTQNFVLCSAPNQHNSPVYDCGEPHLVFHVSITLRQGMLWREPGQVKAVPRSLWAAGFGRDIEQ